MYISLPRTLSKFIVIEKPHPVGIGGVQTILEFPNGYGASIVKFDGSYGYDQGLWEMAVIRFVSEGWEIVYDTPITDDVLGYLQEDKVVAYLQDIQKLT